jgi:hypothetical protein
VENNVDEVFPKKAHLKGIHTAQGDRERLAFCIFAYCLEFEEVIRVGEDDAELMGIWSNGGMSIIKRRNAITCLVYPLTPDAFGDAIIIAPLFEARRRMQIEYDGYRLNPSLMIKGCRYREHLQGCRNTSFPMPSLQMLEYLTSI